MTTPRKSRPARKLQGEGFPMHPQPTATEAPVHLRWGLPIRPLRSAFGRNMPIPVREDGRVAPIELNKPYSCA